MTKRLVVTVGPPGAGKTTWAESLDRSDWLVLCQDDFRAAMFGTRGFFWTSVVEKHGMDARRYVWRVFKFALQDALRDNRFNIAVVNTHVFPGHVNRLLATLGAHEPRMELMVFDAKPETLWARNLARGPGQPNGDAIAAGPLAEYMNAFYARDAWWRHKHYDGRRTIVNTDPAEEAGQSAIPGL